MTDEQYHAAPGVSKSSTLDPINKSPAYYLHRKNNPPEETDALRFGRAAHQAILQPHLYKKRCVIMPKFDRRTKDGKASYDRWIEMHDGLTIVTEEEERTIVGMIGAIYSHTHCKELLQYGHAEQAFFWEDSDTGVDCKCKPDFLRSGGVIIDVKTTQDASLNGFTKSLANFRYHVQAAFYLDGVTKVTGEEFTNFIFIAIEKEPPYHIGVYNLDYRSIEQGREDYKNNLVAYARCVKENHFPGFKEEIVDISLPVWAMRID